MGNALVIVLLVTFTFLLVAVLMVPKHVVRAQLRSRLWELRDLIYDTRRSGVFPFEDRAVGALLWRTENAIRVIDYLTPGRVLLAGVEARKMGPEIIAQANAVLNPNLSGLGAEERELYRQYEKRLNMLVFATPFLSTWTGILMVIPVGILGLFSAVAYVLSSRVASWFNQSAEKLRVDEVALGLGQLPAVDRPFAQLVI